MKEFVFFVYNLMKESCGIKQCKVLIRRNKYQKPLGKEFINRGHKFFNIICFYFIISRNFSEHLIWQVIKSP